MTTKCIEEPQGRSAAPRWEEGTGLTRRRRGDASLGLLFLATDKLLIYWGG